MARGNKGYTLDPHEELANATNRRFAAVSDYERILNERGNELLTINEKHGPKSEAYNRARKQLDESESELERIHSVVRRPLNRHRVRWIYFAAFALALALLEAPVNKYLFDVALNSPSYVSYLVSVAFAFFLLVLAHAAGRSIRQVWSEYRRKLIWTSLVLFILISGVLAVLVSILTVGRAATSAVAELSSFSDLLSNVRTSVVSAGIWGALWNAFSDIAALVLATVNIGAIFMTMMLAFFTVDPDKDFDAAASDVQEQRAKLAKMHDRYMHERTEAIARSAPDLAGHSANYKSANGKVVELKTRLGMPLSEKDHEIIDLRDTLAEDTEHEEPDPQPGRAGQPFSDTGDETRGDGNVHRVTPRVVSSDRI